MRVLWICSLGVCSAESAGSMAEQCDIVAEYG